jgi:outer membrane protein OmpA-like peptidoglycan-associated protein/Tol biopolymer transport system component
MKTLLLLLVSATCLFGQSNIIFKEDFSSDVRGFVLNENQRLADGTLLLNTPEDGDEALINIYLDPHRDFVVSAQLKQLAGLIEEPFGFVWGSDNVKGNYFMINSSGEYATHSGDLSQLKKWKASASINPLGKINELKIQKSVGTVSFFINDQKVEEQKLPLVYGNWIGILSLAQMQLSIDNFTIMQDQTIVLPEKVADFAAKENLGAGVNSEDDELGPIISADGKTLYFARQNVKENIGGEYDDEDIWYSILENSTWLKAKNVGRSLNTGLADNLVAVSADNNTMVFEKDNAFAVRHRTATGWSDFEKLNLTFNNESDFFVATISSDGKAIIFSAKLKENVAYEPNRQEGDLYVTVKDTNNKWSRPLNLGSVINTSGDETSPFLSADGKTLYFATDGRAGYGYQDIFFSRRNGDSWTDWTPPVNLGPAVNTAGFDAYYTVPASGDYAYFVSYDKGIGKADIFRIKLHEDVKPNPVILVKGIVINKTTQDPLAAIIHFENLSTRTSIGEARSDPKTGRYQIILPYGAHYGIRASTDGYYSVHENLELASKSTYAEVTKDLLMVPIQIGETVKLNNVFFVAGLPELRSESYPELDRLVTILKENVGIYIQLEGHTDAKGNADALLKLSQERVDAVKSYLVKNGIGSERISGQGFGATRPVAPSDTEENSKLNRRVEFKITKK